MDIVERFKKYIAIDTMSDENSGTHPSTKVQLDFGKLLLNDLKELGIPGVFQDEHGYVYAFIDNKKEKTVGLIAHMDTAPTIKGDIKNPKIIEKYDGQDISLSQNYTMKVSDFPVLKEVIGEELMVTDGEHLLGGDDKAGIAIIFDFLAYYLEHKDEFKHNLSICFTPDEEIGEGPMFFDVKKMNANIAYTIDGGTIYEASFENFNAMSAKIDITGVGVHPGYAKDVMINASLLGVLINNNLPAEMIPSKTSDHEGFIHLTSINGDVENCHLEYILRDHDQELLLNKKQMLIDSVNKVQKLYEKSTILINFKEEYKNMNTYFIKDPTAITVINKAYLASKTKLKYSPIRGGTDGATITYLGLPCPNLGTGDYNAHGRFEFVSLTQMKKMTEIIKNIFKADF